MLARQLTGIQDRKRALIHESQLHRESLEHNLKPVCAVVHRLEQGFALARKARSLLLVCAPVAALLLKRKGGFFKTALSLASHWRLLRELFGAFLKRDHQKIAMKDQVTGSR